MPGQLDLRLITKPNEVTDSHLLFMMMKGPEYFVTLNGEEIRVLANGTVYYKRFGDRLPTEALIHNIIQFIFLDVATPKLHEIFCAMCGRKFGQFWGEDGDDFGEYYHCAPCQKEYWRKRELEEEGMDIDW